MNNIIHKKLHSIIYIIKTLLKKYCLKNCLCFTQIRERLFLLFLFQFNVDSSEIDESNARKYPKDRFSLVEFNEK